MECSYKFHLTPRWTPRNSFQFRNGPKSKIPNNVGATVKCHVADQCLAQVSVHERRLTVSVSAQFYHMP